MNDTLNLVRGGVDRDCASRSDRSLVTEPSARFLVVSGDKVAMDGASPLLADVRRLEALGFDVARAIYLGRVDGLPCFVLNTRDAVPVADGELADAVPAGVAAVSENYDPLADVEWGSVRYQAHTWTAAESTLVVEALAITAWHERARYCERCGESLHARSDGWSRECSAGHLTFPRTDPAAIMAVTDSSGRLLIGHNRAWDPGKVSVLAGFVEAGEPAEEAVAREVSEEVGITVRDVRFVASQPWPFPRSLMLAFEARTDAGDADLRPDGEELEWARFVTREEYAAATAAGELLGPSATSVASVLIGRWLRGE